MNKALDLIKKNKEFILYGFFGVCTTIVNIAVYAVSYNLLNISNVVSTVIAWIIAVLFAYVTNKLFVFESKSWKADVIVKECISFFGCRFLTGVLDVAIMYVSVDLLNLNNLLFKIISNILVIILNYVASKLIIFKKAEE